MQLREPEVRALLDCAADTASAPDIATFRERAMAGARRIVACDSVTYNEVDSVRRQVAWAADPVGAADLTDGPEIFARGMHEHPLIAHVRRSGDPRALRISDVSSSRAFRRLELYADFFRPLGVEHQMAVVLRPGHNRIIGLALDRGGRDFSERDRAKLELLRAPLTRALALVLARADAAQRLAALERGLAEDRSGVVVVGPAGRLDALGDAAQLLLRRIDVVALTAWLDARPTTRLVQASASDRVTVRFVAAAGSEPDLLLLAVERDALCDDALAERGLTRREAEVLRHVAAGATNDQIAARLQLSSRTVQKHLEHVFAKLGVATRMAAVAAADGSTADAAGRTASDAGADPDVHHARQARPLQELGHG